MSIECSSVTNAETILKRVTGITMLLVCLVLLFTTSQSYFYKDDFGEIWGIRHEIRAETSNMLLVPELTGHFRPLDKVLLLLNYLVSGLNPTSYFITSIVLFFLNVLALFFLAQAISKSTLLAYCATLLLLLQANTYIYMVNWITAAYPNMLVSLFSMVCILFYIQSIRNSHFGKLFYLLSLISFMLALLSKELALVLIVVLPMYDLLFGWLNSSNKVRTFAYMVVRYIPFAIPLIGYLFLRDAAGARLVTGGGDYTFQFGPNVLQNLAFFVPQLGLLPGVVVLLSLPILLSNRCHLERDDLKIILFGLFLGVVSLLPVLFFSWNSPTWLFSPAIGTTLAAAVLFKRVLDEWAKKGARLAILGVIVSAILGCAVLFWRLDQDRWLQWGTFTRNVLVETQKQYPTLPQGARFFFIDRNTGKKYGYDRLFSSFIEDALRLWYDDDTLEAYSYNNAVLSQWRREQSAGGRQLFVFEYLDGHVTDKTSEFR